MPTIVAKVYAMPYACVCLAFDLQLSPIQRPSVVVFISLCQSTFLSSLS